MATIEDILKNLGDPSSVLRKTPVGGGDINEAFHVQTKNQHYFIKRNRQVPAHFFQAEARGLELIRATDTIDVPEVYHYDEQESGDMYLVMQHIEKRSPTPLAEERLGERVARMHRTSGKGYGFDQSTFVGELDQTNALFSSWPAYYRDSRILPQLELAERNKRLPSDRKSRAYRLLENLGTLLPEDPGASLLHGDLWGGNWLTGSDDTPFLIDPSVLYGDRLMDISFTELFGGYSRTFYDAYDSESPLPDYYEEVKPLYQLFYLLVHLNLFGEAYGRSVDHILARYT